MSPILSWIFKPTIEMKTYSSVPVLLAAACILGGTLSAGAAVVTSLADSGPGTLREAVAVANTNAGGGVITFDAALAAQTITLTSGQIAITNDLTIDASALSGRIVISGNASSRLFRIAPAASVRLDSLVLTSGSISNDSGGAILNSGRLTAVNCLFANNTTRGGAGQNTGAGSNGGPGGGGAGMGGAIFSDGAILSLTNCVFSANSAFGGRGGNGDGNGFDSDPGGNGGGPNAGLGGAVGNAGGAGGYGGGGGGGAGSSLTGYAGGAGGFGGGGGGGGALGGGGSGGVGGQGGSYGGHGGSASSSHSGGGGGGAGLGGAVFARAGTVTIANCTFTGNVATNGLGGFGSFGYGNGARGQGVGGAVFSESPELLLVNNVFIGNVASSFAPDVHSFRIWSLADSGLGSLRQAVVSANAANFAPTITFEDSLAGQTITLTSGQLAVSNGLTIDASALAEGIVISGNANSRLFEIAPAGRSDAELAGAGLGQCFQRQRGSRSEFGRAHGDQLPVHEQHHRGAARARLPAPAPTVVQAAAGPAWVAPFSRTAPF